MELGKAEVSEAAADVPEFDFDPDKLIGRSDVNGGDTSGGVDVYEGDTTPETLLHDPGQLATPIEGLKRTQQDFERLDNGNTIFDHPQETGLLLNSNQGEAVENFASDCGLVSAENICRLAGKDLSEADVITIARANNDCDDHVLFHVEDNGAATSDQICDVLSHLGIDARVDERPSLEKVADAVESGRGVIACVETSRFWESWPFFGGHAVTVTSVERNPAGEIIAFYVCDSGTGGKDACRRVEADRLSGSLMETITTEKPIW